MERPEGSEGSEEIEDIEVADLFSKLAEFWSEMVDLSKVEGYGHMIKSIKHLVKRHRMRKWPMRFLRMMYATGPGGGPPRKGMKLCDVTKLMLLFIGNQYDVCCIAPWILLRLAASDETSKDLKAQRTISRMIFSHDAALNNPTSVRYYDLNERKYKTIERYTSVYIPEIE